MFRSASGNPASPTEPAPGAATPVWTRRVAVIAALLAIVATTWFGRAATGSAPQSRAEWLEPCGQYQCGTYEVWEDRDAAAGRRIALNVVVAPATGPERRDDPFFYFAGGPGGSATALAGGLGNEPYHSINRERDIVLVDRRGTGQRDRLNCDLYGNTAQGHLREFLPVDAIRRCRAELEQRADLSLYTTPLAMADVNEIREALGYEQINTLGISYGTRESTDLIRRYPETVRSAIMIGVADPAYAMPEQYARFVQDALDAVILDCRAAPACAAAYPDFGGELVRLAAQLREQPVLVDIETPPGLQPGPPVEFGRDAFAEMVRYLLYSTATANRLPWLIHEATLGNWVPLVEWSVQRRRALAGGDGLFLSVTCAQDVPFVRDSVAESARNTLLGMYRVEQQRRACDLWPRGELPEDYREPLRTDIPILLISGTRDPVTPPSGAVRMIPTLGDALHLEVPGAAHGISGVVGGECVDQAMLDFLDGGTTAVDPSCLAEVHREPFRPRNLAPRRHGSSWPHLTAR